MTRNYQVRSVEPRSRISYEDFYRPRNCTTLVRVEDGEVLKVLFPIRRSPKRGDDLWLDDDEVQAILEDATPSAGSPLALTR